MGSTGKQNGPLIKQLGDIMKNYIIATLFAFVASVGIAQADGIRGFSEPSVVPSEQIADNLAFIGSAQYAFQTRTFETRLGMEYTYNSFTFIPILVGNNAAGNFNFAGAEFGVRYSVSQNFNLYGVIEADSNFNYSEATIGVAFRF
jgi:hypothetical protein